MEEEFGAERPPAADAPERPGEDDNSGLARSETVAQVVVAEPPARAPFSVSEGLNADMTLPVRAASSTSTTEPGPVELDLNIIVKTEHGAPAPATGTVAEPINIDATEPPVKINTPLEKANSFGTSKAAASVTNEAVTVSLALEKDKEKDAKDAAPEMKSKTEEAKEQAPRTDLWMKLISKRHSFMDAVVIKTDDPIELCNVVHLDDSPVLGRTFWLATEVTSLA